MDTIIQIFTKWKAKLPRSNRRLEIGRTGKPVGEHDLYFPPFHGPVASMEMRLSCTEDFTGSSPVCVHHLWAVELHRVVVSMASRKFRWEHYPHGPPFCLWACSSVGRVLQWHWRGRRFEPDQVHHFVSEECVVEPYQEGGKSRQWLDTVDRMKVRMKHVTNNGRVA